MKIALASDHAGFELKEAIKEYLTEHKLTDFYRCLLYDPNILRIKHGMSIMHVP